MSKNLKIALISIAGILLLVLVAGGSYYLSQNKTQNPVNQTVDNTQQASSTNQVADSKPNTVARKALFGGELKKIDQDLKIIKPESYGTADSKESFASPARYYEAGKFLDGKYKGYSRIIALVDSPGGGINYTLITNDNKRFIILNYASYSGVDKSLNSLEKIDEGNIVFDQSKILSVDYTDEELPDILNLNTTFDAKKGDIYTANNLSDNTTVINSVTTPNKFTKLAFPGVSYDIYTPMTVSDQTGAGVKYSDPDQIEGLSTIVIADSAGVPYTYSIAWKSDLDKKSQFDKEFKSQTDILNAYNTKRSDREEELGIDKNFSDKISKQIDTELGEAPAYPNEKIYNLSFDTSKFKITSPIQTFKSYSTAFPGGCGVIGSLTVKELPNSEITQVGTIQNLPLYKIKDSSNQLYKDQYKAKITSQITSLDENGKEIAKPENFATLNSGAKMPTFEEYVKQNPLLLFRDPFNRMVIAGEWDYQLQGGCGKPVVYLYPSTPTKVNVKFLANIQLTTDIPKYVENLGWNVLAKPDGELTDLQTKYTNCDIFDNSHTGSEYAKESCKQNNYPYLYWSGNRIGAEYPKIENGWIVEKKDLSTFLDSKLDQVGLTQKEKSDMLDYWIPYLSSKSGNYFKISFLQTKEMNNLAPMQITPRPDKVFRIFLDWDNYSLKPELEIQPQILDKLSNRSGFTVVEWGGLKK